MSVDEFDRLRSVGKINERTQSFADEWQARDVVLSPSELRAVKNAADVLGVKFDYTPTGRYVDALLQHAMNLALQRHSQATDRYERAAWYGTYLRAKNALGKHLN